MYASLGSGIAFLACAFVLSVVFCLFFPGSPVFRQFALLSCQANVYICIMLMYVPVRARSPFMLIPVF